MRTMVNLKLTASGNAMNGEVVDTSRFSIVDFLEIETGNEVVSFAVNAFIAKLQRTLATAPKGDAGWSTSGILALRKKEEQGIEVTPSMGALCRPFTVPLKQGELLAALQAGEIQRDQILELARQLQVKACTEKA